MRSEAWREFLIGATCGLLLGLNWFLPRRGDGVLYLSPLLAGALIVYLARRTRNLAATGHGWRNDLVVTAKTGVDAAVVYILIQNAMYYGMSGRGPFSRAFPPEHHLEWAFVKSLMTNTLIQGLTMVPLATIIGGFAARFLLRAREHKSRESESSRERIIVR